MFKNAFKSLFRKVISHLHFKYVVQENIAELDRIMKPIKTELELSFQSSNPLMDTSIFSEIIIDWNIEEIDLGEASAPLLFVTRAYDYHTTIISELLDKYEADYYSGNADCSFEEFLHQCGIKYYILSGAK